MVLVVKSDTGVLVQARAMGGLDILVNSGMFARLYMINFAVAALSQCCSLQH